VTDYARQKSGVVIKKAGRSVRFFLFESVMYHRFWRAITAAGI
jgi:hypothetical protein